jgi:hypothetical protein
MFRQAPQDSMNATVSVLAIRGTAGEGVEKLTFWLLQNITARASASWLESVAYFSAPVHVNLFV